jgi:hypothetical protein
MRSCSTKAWPWSAIDDTAVVQNPFRRRTASAAARRSRRARRQLIEWQLVLQHVQVRKAEKRRGFAPFSVHGHVSGSMSPGLIDRIARRVGVQSVRSLRNVRGVFRQKNARPAGTQKAQKVCPANLQVQRLDEVTEPSFTVLPLVVRESDIPHPKRFGRNHFLIIWICRQRRCSRRLPRRMRQGIDLR